MNDLLSDFDKLLSESDDLTEIIFDDLKGEKLQETEELNADSPWQGVKVQVEAVFGSALLPLSKVAAINPDMILPLEQSEDELCELLINGKKIGKGRIVAQKGRYGIQIVSLRP